jgi:hypothetical protein
MDNPFKNMSKPQLYATMVGGLAIGGYALYKKHSTTGSWNPFSSGTSTSPSTTSDGTATSIDPITGLAYSDDNATDPITGDTYLAEAQQYGSVAAAEASVSDYGGSTATGSGIPVNPASPASSGSVNTVVGTSVYTSNAAWAQAVQAGLEDISGGTTYDGTDIGQALGDYLTQEPLTAAQAQVVNVAIAEYGPAPVGNLQVILAPSSGTGSTMVSVPNVIGRTDLDTAEGIITSAGLKAAATGDSGTGNKGSVTAQSPSAGTSVTPGTTVTLTYTVSGSSADVTVPDLTGLELDRVGTAVSAVGLKYKGGQPNKPGSIRWVVSQSPKAGTEVDKGSTITVTTQYGSSKDPYPPTSK